MFCLPEQDNGRELDSAAEEGESAEALNSPSKSSDYGAGARSDRSRKEYRAYV